MDIPAPTEPEEHTPLNPAYPEVTVQLSGLNGNIGTLMAAVSDGLKRFGAHREDINDMRKNVFASKSYDEALQVLMSWVNVR